MAESKRDFAERLLEREEVDPMRMEKLREQIGLVLELKLSRAQHVASIAAGVLSVVLGLAFVLLARRRWDELPAMAYVIIVAGIIGLLLVGVFAIGVGRRGVFDRRYHGRQFLGVALIICLGAGTAFLHAGWASGDGQLVFGGTAMLVLGGGGFALYTLEQYHLSTKRKLLELELRLAEIAERLDRLSV